MDGGSTSQFSVDYQGDVVGAIHTGTEFKIGTPLGSAPACTSGTYWLAGIGGTTNAWQQCNNGTLSGLGLPDPGGNGIVKRTALNTTGVAAAADVVGLFGSGSCSGYLKSDGTCATPTGAGTVTGTGTGGYIASWSGSGAGQSGIANSHLDDGVTTAGAITSTEPLHVTGLPAGCVQTPCTVASAGGTTTSTTGVGYAFTYSPAALGLYRYCGYVDIIVAGTAGNYDLVANYTTDGHSFNAQSGNASAASQWSSINACYEFTADASSNIIGNLNSGGVTGTPTVRYSMTLELLK
jgi:hypothetical protein